MRFYFLLLFLFTFEVSFSQLGDFITTDHTHHLANIDHITFDITRDQHGLLCLANRSGVLDYDGIDWSFYKTPSAALSIVADSMNLIYVSCINSLGIIDRNLPSDQFREIIQIDSLNDIFLDAFKLKEEIVFIGGKYIISYNVASRELSITKGEFLNGYFLGDDLIINDLYGSPFLFGDSLISAPFSKTITFTSKEKNGQQLALDLSGQVLKYQDGTFDPLYQSKLLKRKGIELQEIEWINDTLIAGSSMESGVVFFNTKDTSFFKVSNYQTGLPDNEVFTMETDASGVWAAHPFGLSRIAPLFPAASYSSYPGLNGNLTSSSVIDGELWVTSSLGVFYFKKDTLFENKVYYEKVPIKRNRGAKTVPKEESTKQPQPDTDNNESKPNKMSIKRLFGKKERATITDQEPTKGTDKKKGLFKSIREEITNLFEAGNNVSTVKGGLEKDYRYIRKSRKVPIGVDYRFVKVPEANGKFLEILPTKEVLLGVGNSGIFEITKNGAKKIISEKIRKAIVTQDDQLVLSTSNLEIKTFQLIQDVWVEKFVRPIDDIIVNLREDDNGTFWLAGSSKIFKAHITDSSFHIEKNYSIENKYLDEVEIFDIANKTYFVNTQGYFFYNVLTDSIQKDHSLEEQLGKPKNYLFDAIEASLYTYNGKKWSQIDSTGSIQTFEYLNIFPNLNSIAFDPKNKSLWLLIQNNYILQFFPDLAKNYQEAYPLFVKRTSHGTPGDEGSFTLAYDQNFLTVELSKPDFNGLLNTEFQYKLEGLYNNWSGWTKSRTIDFSYLPAGSYRLHVRSRDAFGRQEEAELMAFRVKPPYWQTLWFYALEALFIGTLVLLSSRMNQSNSANRFLSGALTVLTLVIIIEFLQSAIGSLIAFKSTPVIDFAIDAIIAIMIFPLENFLRKFITKGKVDIPIKFRKSSVIPGTAKK